MQSINVVSVESNPFELNGQKGFHIDIKAKTLNGIPKSFHYTSPSNNIDVKGILESQGYKVLSVLN